jgi:hypothetical protein
MREIRVGQYGDSGEAERSTLNRMDSERIRAGNDEESAA